MFRSAFINFQTCAVQAMKALVNAQAGLILRLSICHKFQNVTSWFTCCALWFVAQTPLCKSCDLKHYTGLQIRVRIGKLFSLFLIQIICCGYSKEPSQ